MKCLNCSKEFEAKRATAKYCSAKCRVEHGRLSVTDGLSVTPVSVTKLSVTDDNVTLKPASYGLPDCQCQHCQTNRTNGNRSKINHSLWKPASKLGRSETNRVSLPGDIDYHGAAESMVAI